jgi:V/A-type H+/Na+-transporting ATPase subunit E
MATTDTQTQGGTPASSGVQELIDRMRGEGVAKGRDEADALLAEARKEASQILDQANRDADQIRVAARTEADRLSASTKDSLQLAARDAVLALGETLRADFLCKMRRLVSHTMQDRSFLERLILEVARKSTPDDESQPVTVLLPSDVLTYEELKQNPADLAENFLSRFVLELSADVLREGLSFSPAEDERPGLRIQLKDEGVEIDLTDEAVTDLLMAHLSPRFRALMDQAKS